MKAQLWLVLLTALFLAGCGGSSDTGTGTAPATSYTLSGTITDNNQPLGSVMVRLTSPGTDNSATTAADGTYSFTGVVNGTYTVTPSHPGHTFNPLERANIVVNGKNVPGLDFATAIPATYTVSGVITPPLDLVDVSLTNNSTASTVTVRADKTNGSYSFPNISTGKYTVKPSRTGYNFTPPDRAVDINGFNAQGMNFEAKAITAGYSISGRVTQNNTALPGVTLSLTGTASASRVTDANGNYSFDGLAVGGYTLTPTPQAGLSFTPSQPVSVNISNANVLQDFTVTSTTGVTRNYTLYIKSGTLTINGNGGTTLNTWGYTDVASGPPQFPGPQLNANAGDTVTVTVVNNHTIPHNFMIKGVTSDTAALAANGGRKTYSFTTSEGTYLYYDTLNNNINREMGLYGALIVGSANGSPQAWTNPYTFQRIWVIGEMDKPRWNDVANGPNTVATAVYKPNYFLISGKGGFDGMHDPNITIAGTVGQTAIVRIANGGQFTHSLHFHSNHVKVLAKNGVQEVSPKELDVVAVPPLGTVDVLFYLNQEGEYPMHVHTAQLETANGVYLNGVATLISIAPK